LMRYAKPVVANALCRSLLSVRSSEGVGEEDERGVRSIMGSEEKEVVILRVLSLESGWILRRLYTYCTEQSEGLVTLLIPTYFHENRRSLQRDWMPVLFVASRQQQRGSDAVPSTN